LGLAKTGLDENAYNALGDIFAGRYVDKEEEKLLKKLAN
jgi:hypothetical protein